MKKIMLFVGLLLCSVAWGQTPTLEEVKSECVERTKHLLLNPPSFELINITKYDFCFHFDYFEKARVMCRIDEIKCNGGYQYIAHDTLIPYIFKSDRQYIETLCFKYEHLLQCLHTYDSLYDDINYAYVDELYGLSEIRNKMAFDYVKLHLSLLQWRLRSQLFIDDSEGDKIEQLKDLRCSYSVLYDCHDSLPTFRLDYIKRDWERRFSDEYDKCEINPSLYLSIMINVYNSSFSYFDHIRFSKNKELYSNDKSKTRKEQKVFVREKRFLVNKIDSLFMDIETYLALPNILDVQTLDTIMITKRLYTKIYDETLHKKELNEMQILMSQLRNEGETLVVKFRATNGYGGYEEQEVQYNITDYSNIYNNNYHYNHSGLYPEGVFKR